MCLDSPLIDPGTRPRFSFFQAYCAYLRSSRFIIVPELRNFCNTKKGKKQKYFKEVVGFLFQNFALLENKTVKENLEIIKKSGRTDILINEALEKVGLQKVINKKVYQLSGGEQQRVALARLMLKKCSIVLADEPTGSLDKKNSEIVMNILHELSEQGKTVIVVTHSEEIVAQEKHVLYL